MKKFLVFIFSVGIFFLLVILGVSLSAKGILMDTADGLVKNEIKNNMVKVVEESTSEAIPSEVVKKIEKELENNASIKKMLNKYYDQLMEVLTTDKNELSIDIEKEVEMLINENEAILKEYGITLSESDKQQILDLVSSEELNKVVNENIEEIKNNLSSDTKIVLDGYRFLTGDTFRGIIISVLLILVVLICLLKKNYYGWLFNFSITSFLVGIFYVVISLITNAIIYDTLEENGITISIDSLSMYGYILVGLAVMAFVIYSIFKRRKEEVQQDTLAVEG